MRFDSQEKYELVLLNYKKLRRLGGRAGFSITVHRDNERDLVDIVDTFFSQYNPDGIGLGLPMFYSTGDVGAADIDIANYAKTLEKLFDLSVKYNGFLPYIAAKLRPLISGKFRKYWCEAIGDTRTFMPSGKEILCSRLAARMNLSKEMLESWIPINNPFCLECDAIGICGGGCPWSANMWFKNHVDERECVVNKQMLPFLLWQLTNVSTSIYDDSLADRFKMVAWPR